MVTTSHPDCVLIGGTSLGVSPARRYHSPPTLLLNVPGQVAAFWEIKKNLQGLSPITLRNALWSTGLYHVPRYAVTRVSKEQSASTFNSL